MKFLLLLLILFSLAISLKIDSLNNHFVTRPKPIPRVTKLPPKTKPITKPKPKPNGKGKNNDH
jgi:hypothetical protein